jgi:butyrate kinase
MTDARRRSDQARQAAMDLREELLDAVAKGEMVVVLNGRHEAVSLSGGAAESCSGSPV